MSLPGTKFARKRDAIDTDQITPAADCVSESLETLDEKWKAGSFRHLMPDFRERVHRGENFIIAGDRFAIGSSREMSPAGLKGVAEEAGLEMVVVCGQNMGDIFRRNSFNLGSARRAESRSRGRRAGRRRLQLRSRNPRLTNVTPARTYDPVPLQQRKKTSGGAAGSSRSDAVNSRRRSCRPVRRLARRPDARAMTTTEQIVWAHRVDKQLKPPS